MQDVLQGVIGRVGPVYRSQHVFADVGEGCGSAEVVVDDACCRLGVRIDDEVVGLIDANGLRQVMVERQVDARHVRQVGGDVAVGDRHLAVLHVFGVNEQDVVDHVQFTEEHSAYESVEIAASDQAVFVCHGESSCGVGCSHLVGIDSLWL